MVIDTHHHFWEYSSQEYPWIDDSMEKIRHDFLPNNLKYLLSEAGVDGVISVQARQNLAETEWLLSLARSHDFIKGVVGWLPLANGTIEAELERLSAFPKLCAVRHVLQDEENDHYMLRADFNTGISRLAGYGLAYDILITERHLPQTIEFVDRHPNQVFVLDHMAKPRIRENALEPWAARIRCLAERPNLFCKVSGMVTEADFASWTPSQLRPYFDTVLEAFGPDRLMFGSDWPPCLVACEYEQWLEVVRLFAAELSPSEHADLFGKTAQRAYDLQP